MTYKPKRLKYNRLKPKEKKRESAAQRGYNYRWQQIRIQYLINHPLCQCEECLKNNRLTTANVIHHKIEHQGNYDLFWDQDNWMPMNNICHDKHHMKKKKEEGKL